ncbi:probable beta-tubulin polyglutamylase isoform X2 [Mercenaria mercenaria]|uniref:probable beta-tubulin polyglutamylase isoform X2 n=1 Tax=Mercenaria mercenaria TaxID=6596 RepID=UPI00234FAB38|nr:probable beta-tubulin polyglutamylase isoform X2 [Mercenaria mercenaria]
MADTEPNLTESSEESALKFKYTTYETNYIVSDNKSEENVSLQEAFRRYREAKQDELRQARLLRKRQELRKADPQKMAALRQKFLDQAKKYYGYPYARKYWPPDSPEYKSKLFLDCCGLVRRVMRDLADDFGFIIGPWNQAYMFDTLPIVVKSEKDMKPGDLVFISAIYYNPKSKKQRHNMTHVEIWAGEGCKTIGARWNNGKVQMWDSYKFLAKSYHSETYHFRSIDTWLKGLCTSHCSQHSWKRSKYSPTKKSIFALPEQIEEDEAAGDDDDNVDSFNMRGNTFINQVSDVNKMLSRCELSGIQRPKTELDSPYRRMNTPGTSQKASDAEFPTIRNDLKGKGKSVLNRMTKTKCSTEVKQERNSRELPTAGGNSVDRNKEQGQLTISGSLDDLGRKGLYLRDLVDSQRVDNYDEDVEGESEREDEMEELENAEEFDYDDDYFIFANDDDDDDVDDDDFTKKKDTEDHSNESSKFIKGDTVESDTENIAGNKTATTCDTAAKTVRNGKESKIENTEIQCIITENGIAEKNVKNIADENKNASSSEKDRNENAEQKFRSINENAELKKTEEDQHKKVSVIENVFPLGHFENNKPTKFVHTENISQNANPKVTEKQQSKEKARIQCVKASIITVVSQSDGSRSQSSCSSSSTLPSGSQTSCTSSSQASSTTGSHASSKTSSKADSITNSKISSSFGSQASSTNGSQSSFASNSQASSASLVLPSESKTSEISEVDAQSNDIETSEITGKQDGPKSSTVIETGAPPDVKEENNANDFGKRGQRKKSPDDTKTTKLPFCGNSTNRPTFYVGNGNGVSLVEGPLTSLGWRRITDKHNERFKLKWVQCKTTINYDAFKEGDQLVNHIPNSQLLTNKLGLLNSLRQYERTSLSTKGRLPRLKLSDFHPETYKLDDKTERESFLQVFKDNEVWICKPTGLNQGKGIFLIRTREEIDKVLEEQEQKKQQTQNPGRPVMNRIVQRYIPNPLLLEGRKFDIRAYMLVASTVPFLILFHQGYVRLCCHKYEADNSDLGIHLTNQFVQKKDPNYEKLKESTAWSMVKFNEYINQNVRPDCPVEIEEDWVFNTFTKQMKKIMIHCFNSVKHKLQSRIGFFDLFGLDFMIDTNMKTWLIEVNVNPSLAQECRCQKELFPGLIAESLYVAIECFEKSKKNQPLMPLQSLKGFEVLYCGTQQNTSSPKRSRSFSADKESSSTEKPKPVQLNSIRGVSVPSQQGPRLSTETTALHIADPKQSSEKSNKSGNSSNKKTMSIKREKTDTNMKISNTTNSKQVKGGDSSKGAGNCENTAENEKDTKKIDNKTEAPKQTVDPVIIDSVTEHSDLKEANLKTTGEETVDFPKKSKSRGRGNLERGN